MNLTKLRRINGIREKRLWRMDGKAIEKIEITPFDRKLINPFLSFSCCFGGF